LYKVKQSSRYDVLCQLKSILQSSFPKYVIRTDIRDFYESISNEKLLNKIDRDALLTLPSRNVTRQILRDYRDLSHSSAGVPRGIGISAYLSELYIRQFDDAVKAHDDLTFFARYVDDIVLVFVAGILVGTGIQTAVAQSPRPNLRLNHVAVSVKP